MNGSPGATAEFRAAGRIPMQILFLQKRPLFPADTGGKIRTLNVLRYLARWHEVTYLCNEQPGEKAAVEQMRELGLRVITLPWRETPRGTIKFCGELAANLFSPNPYNVDKDYDPALRHEAKRLLKAESFDLLICDFVQMARNAIGLNVPAKILFEHNVEAQIFAQHSRQDEGRFRRWYMQRQWRKMRRFEGEAGREFDAVIAVSKQDRATYQADYHWDHVRVIDTAVDVEYFTPQPKLEQSHRVVFVGSMDWLPNQEGVRHFVRSVWPEIRKQCPQAEFRVVGRNPTSAIEQLGSCPGVEIVGTVPDIRPYLAEAAVVVVPLLIGGGTRMKIFEAMSMQKAIVSTPLGAEGLHVTSGRDIQLAAAGNEFASAVIQLLQNPSQRTSLAAAARQLVVESYSAKTIARQFDKICRETVAQSSSNSRHDHPVQAG